MMRYIARKQRVLGFAIVCATVTLIVLMQVLYTNRSPSIQRPRATQVMFFNRSTHVRNFTCDSGVNSSDLEVEDILCMEPKQFLPNFKNPCWYDYDEYDGKKLKCLPYFHIIGTPKSGTTDLFTRMHKHPQIVSNWGKFSKETWYWSWQRYGLKSDPDKWSTTYMTFSEFISFFKAEEIAEMKVNLKDNTNYSDKITGIGDPMDFAAMESWRMIKQNDPEAREPQYTTPDLVKHMLPDVKLILLLREPTERLYSHYIHGQYGKTAQEFHDDVKDSIEKVNECMESIGLRACVYSKSLVEMLKTPITVSLYAVHLEEWLRVFPRNQIFIMRNEDYEDDPRKYIQGVFRFLDLDDITTKQMTSILKIPRVYETKRKRKFGPMLAETRHLLLDFFAASNKKLSSILKDDRYLWNDNRYPRPKEIQGLQLTNYVRNVIGDEIVVVGKKPELLRVENDYGGNADESKYYGKDRSSDNGNNNEEYNGTETGLREGVSRLVKRFLESKDFSDDKKERLIALLRAYRDDNFDKYYQSKDDRFNLYYTKSSPKRETGSSNRSGRRKSSIFRFFSKRKKSGTTTSKYDNEENEIF